MVSEACFLREHGQECLDHTQRKAITNHNPVDIAGIEMFGRSLDAEGARNIDALAHGNAERRIKGASAGNEHGRIVERVADRQHRQSAVVRCE